MGEIKTERFEFGDNVTVELEIEASPVEEEPIVNQPASNNQESSAIPTVIPTTGESPAMALGNGYQMFSQSMSLLAQNAVNAQQQLTVTQQTATHQELKRVISSQIQPSNSKSQDSLASLQGIIAMLTSLSQP